jgi:hypothetical protein
MHNKDTTFFFFVKNKVENKRQVRITLTRICRDALY